MTITEGCAELRYVQGSEDVISKKNWAVESHLVWLIWSFKAHELSMSILFEMVSYSLEPLPFRWCAIISSGPRHASPFYSTTSDCFHTVAHNRAFCLLHMSIHRLAFQLFWADPGVRCIQNYCFCEFRDCHRNDLCIGSNSVIKKSCRVAEEVEEISWWDIRGISIHTWTQLLKPSQSLSLNFPSNNHRLLC